MHNLTSARPNLNETAGELSANNTNPLQARKDSSSKHGGFTVGGTTDRTAVQTAGGRGANRQNTTTSGFRDRHLPDSVDSQADMEADQSSVIE